MVRTNRTPELPKGILPLVEANVVSNRGGSGSDFTHGLASPSVYEDELDLLTPGVSNYFENTSSQTPFIYPSVPSVRISKLKVSMLELGDRCSKPTLAASKRMNYRGDLYLNGDTCEDAGRRLVWKVRSETSIFNN